MVELRATRKKRKEDEEVSEQAKLAWREAELAKLRE
jgi:hypothetical protein